MKLELKEECWKCEGDGKVYSDIRSKLGASTTEVCDICNGKGFQLTQEGEEIRQFIEDHFKVVIKTDNESGHQELVNIEFKSKLQ